MPHHNRFSYHSLDELREDVARRQLDLPISDNLSILGSGAKFGRLTVPNRLAVQPMEGCDATADGRPSDLTIRRYRRFASGGAGLLWWEACAVVGEGRANPRQLWLHRDSAGAFTDALDAARSAANDAGIAQPVCVLQLTHSGRYSRPAGTAAPIIAHHSPILDPRHNLPDDYPLISDDELDALGDSFVAAAVLAAEAGFDAVDIKSCHRYLLSELLAGFARSDSRYGGSYANRTRMLRETIEKVRQAVGPDIEVTCRINAFDAIKYPYGWGVRVDDAGLADLSEPIRLLGELSDAGLGGVNVTIGNPYFNPYVNRPADWTVAGSPDSPEHPLEGVARLIHITRDIQQSLKTLTVVGCGYTWLRQYMPYFAAGAIEQRWAGIVGLGRGALAYPDFARDILQTGRMDPHKVCVSCSSCTQIMRDGGRTGCVVRDNTVYAPIFREGRLGDPNELRQLAAECRRCIDPMCVALCPAGVDVPGFLGALADGDEPAAYNILRSKNILPEICGAVCPATEQCRSGCIQNYLVGQAVRIAEIQRHLSRRAVEAGWAALEVTAPDTGRRIAIVGAGPAGLAAAAELLRRGHRVVVLERSASRGGKLVTVVPRTRLPRDRCRAEIDAIFDGVCPDRIEWRYRTSLGPDLTLDDLGGEGFDAIVLAAGLGGAGSTDRPGGILDANVFLAHMARNVEHACPQRVAVVGGGNTAIDSAICAAVRGGLDVYLVYRRSYEQMPAWSQERHAVLDAGVHLMLLSQPVGYEKDNHGNVTGLRIARTQLGMPDDTGRRRPVVIDSSEFVLPVDMVIEAIGERIERGISAVLEGVELTDDGLIMADPQTMETSRKGVYAAGDIVTGPATVARAVADGRRAAMHIHAALTGDELDDEDVL